MWHVRFCLPGSCGCTTIGVNAAHCAECRSFSSSLIDFSQKGKHNALLLTVSNRVWVDQWRHQRRAWGGRPPPRRRLPPPKKKNCKNQPLSAKFWIFSRILPPQCPPHKNFCCHHWLEHRNLKTIASQVWQIYKHLKKSNAACFYTPIVLKLLIIIQMWKQHEEGN